jgi:hypothetical protein
MPHYAGISPKKEPALQRAFRQSAFLPACHAERETDRSSAPIINVCG